jgi:glutaredoxin
VKEFLSRDGLRFTLRDVDEDEDAYDELLARGHRSVPVTFIGDESVRGFDPRALRIALNRAAGELPRR